MISMTKTRKIAGEQFYALEVDAEGASYIADVMEDYQPYDAGAMAICREVRAVLDREVVPDE